jgi:hypothetical protein
MISCPICAGEDTLQIYTRTDAHLARYGLKSSAIETKKESLPLDLWRCSNCSFAWNEAFDYSRIDYDGDTIIEAGSFSSKYLSFQRQSAQRISRQYGDEIETVIEIGAGSGLFLKEITAGRKIAIEPSAEAGQIPKDIEVLNEYFERDKFRIASQLVILRQVLEHVPKPLAFLTAIIESFGFDGNMRLYIEVPNSRPTFSQARFYDIYYEHCNYFSVESIVQLAKQLKMSVDTISVELEGELISVSLSPQNTKPDNIRNSLQEKHDALKMRFLTHYDKGNAIMLWGASGNGTQILNQLELSTTIVKSVIDSDRNKQGRFIPGTAQKVISPEQAAQLNPDVIFICSQFHRKEIEDSCRQLMPQAIIERLEL